MSRILCAITAMMLSQAVLAAQKKIENGFVIINHLTVPVQCKVEAGEARLVFDGTIGAKQQSPVIDLRNLALTWISWSYEGQSYKVDFGGTVPLQKDKKNFFNINGTGGFMHNFGGFKKEGLALILDPQKGYITMAEFAK